MTNEREQQFESLSQIRADAEERLYRRVDFGLKAIKMVYGLMAVIVAAGIWIYALQYQVAYNARAIKQLWQTVYHTPLP